VAATHQREQIYLALMQGDCHPTPEELYARVHTLLPSLSLATVYKTLHFFVASGIAGEVTARGAAMRVDANPRPHHHAVCRECGRIYDVELSEEPALDTVRALPEGFEAQRCAVEVQGVCRACAAHQEPAKS
jgi:Fe2+ or Zn2+ uptake regulation protein